MVTSSSILDRTTKWLGLPLTLIFDKDLNSSLWVVEEQPFRVLGGSKEIERVRLLESTTTTRVGISASIEGALCGVMLSLEDN